MADGAKKPQATQPVPFPKNWARMSHAEKVKWQEENRPGFNAAARAAKKPEPAAPAPLFGISPGGAHASSGVGPQEEYNEGTEDTNGGAEATVTDESLPGAVKGVDAQRAIARMLHALADGFDAAARGE